MTDRQAFIDSLKDTAIQGWKDYQILPSIFGSQTSHETSYGTSELAQKAQNFWGIKKRGEGYAYHKETWEVIDGKDEYPVEPFAWYKDFTEGVDWYYNVFHGHLSGEAWRKDTYADVIGETDYRKASKALTGTYATDESYNEKINKVIETYNLVDWDNEALVQTGKAEPVEDTDELKEGQFYLDEQKYQVTEIKEDE